MKVGFQNMILGVKHLMINKEQLELIGYCPVDSGLIMLSDPAIFLMRVPDLISIQKKF